MGTKRAKERPAQTANVHAVLPADVAARLRAFAGHYGRSKSDVIAAAVLAYTRGFSVHVRAGEGRSPGELPEHPERAA